MVIEFIYYSFPTANKAIITRLQKYFTIKMLKPSNLAIIFAFDKLLYDVARTLFDIFLAHCDAGIPCPYHFDCCYSNCRLSYGR
jgi:hypothetical protein